MNDPLTKISTLRTPQSQPDADPAIAARQKRNAAGGYVFGISDEAHIHRFLTLGTTGGTYYTGEAELTRANAEVVLAAARDRGLWLAEQAAAISVAGRAPRQNPAIFALAAVAGLGDEEARRYALAQLPYVCRTGTTLFTFVRYVRQFRGWGPALTKAVARWYQDKPVDDVAYQVVKYRQRDGMSQRDVLRLAHPKTDDPARNALYRWIVDPAAKTEGAPLPGLVYAFEAAQTPGLMQANLLHLIADHPLSWEMLPDAARTPEVWKALIRKGMPQTALMRQLPTLTRLGVLDDPGTLGTVVRQLTSTDRLRKARVHPVNVLVAMKTYAAGNSMRGSSTWTPNRKIIDALDAAFYAAFHTIEPANKRTLIALDVSGSMGSPASGLPISCREVAAAMSLVTLATEPSCDVVGFTSSATPRRGGYGGWGRGNGIAELTISPRQRLDDVVNYTASLDFGGTDCALPFRWARERNRAYDTVIVMTDSETWAGPEHVHQALARYRDWMGTPVRSIVVGMTATDCSIANPLDPHSLDVAGFDSAVPNLIADFSRGEV